MNGEISTVTDYRVADSFFGPPYIDIDEWRDAPTRHRYVHGGFEGTDTRFSLYFPPSECYRGRSLQFLLGGLGGSEHTCGGEHPNPMSGGLKPAWSLGAYLVESNQGHIGSRMCMKAGDDRTIYSYRASAETNRFARSIATEMYGETPRYHYLYGGSGGGKRSVECMENVTDVWDGAVPLVTGSPQVPLSMTFSMMLNARRLLSRKMESILDATEPGGSGDPFENLTIIERQALADLYEMGFPRGSERALLRSLAADMLFTWEADPLTRFDPSFVTDFFTKPGYAGCDQPDAIETHLIDTKSSVARLVTARALTQEMPGAGSFAAAVAGGDLDRTVGIALEVDLPADPRGTRVEFLTGEATGRHLYCYRFEPNGTMLLAAGGEVGSMLLDGVRPGDTVSIDNRLFLAYCYYYRHHVVPGLAAYSSLVVDGRSIYPQRPIEPWIPMHGLETRTGQFGDRKMIVVQCAHDTSAWPLQAVAYDALVHQVLGEQVDERFRLYWVEHGEHNPPAALAGIGYEDALACIVDYSGMVEQALHDLAQWVEDGVTPPASTTYTTDHHNAVHLAATAEERRGTQPVVHLRANGASRAEVATGETVRLEAEASVPPGTGFITAVEWDVEGTGAWASGEDIDPETSTGRFSLMHEYIQAGTYFPGVRVTAHRHGDSTSVLCRVQNLARGRVVVA